MLDGQGADEVLGGYHDFFPVVAAQLLRRRRFLRYARFHREHKELLDRAPLPPLGVISTAVPNPARRWTSKRRVPLPASASLVSPELQGLAREWYPIRLPGSLQEQLHLNTESLGLPSLLRVEDRNSMAHSIEARVPILDHRLVEFAFRLPDELKIRGVETKHILREAMRGILPEEVRARRDKVGFRAEPAATWVLAERHRDSLLANRNDYEARWFDSGALAEVLDGSDRSGDTEFMVWRAINAKIWLRLHWGEGDPLA